MQRLEDHAKISPFYTAVEAAEYLRLEERTLNNMRWRGEGPGWRKHGGKVIYHIDEMEKWSKQRNQTHDGKEIIGNNG